MISPLFGQLISGPESFRVFNAALSGSADRQVVIASAYAKMATMTTVGKSVPDGSPVRVLTRWQPRDLLTGASDLECYMYACGRGWDFYVSTDFHGKVYLVDQAVVLIGSANLTGAGYGASRISNEEVMVAVEPTSSNRAKTFQLFESATLVTSELFEAMKGFLLEQKSASNDFEAGNLKWPPSIQKALSPPSRSDLLVSETFWSNGQWVSGDSEKKSGALVDVSISHDLSLLGYNSCDEIRRLSYHQLSEAVCNTKFYGWLQMQLESAPSHEMYFGAVTAKLHEALIDDPKPYRRDVKSLLANLLAWINLVDSQQIVVDRPSYSERLRLLI